MGVAGPIAPTSWRYWRRSGQPSSVLTSARRPCGASSSTSYSAACSLTRRIEDKPSETQEHDSPVGHHRGRGRRLKNNQRSPDIEAARRACVHPQEPGVGGCVWLTNCLKKSNSRPVPAGYSRTCFDAAYSAEAAIDRPPPPQARVLSGLDCAHDRMAN